jgi:hypothetical protein
MQRDILLLSEMVDAAGQAQRLVAGLSAAEVGADRMRRDSLLWNFTVHGYWSVDVEIARQQRLAALAAECDGAWARVAARIAEKKPSGYDVAVDLLVDLREVCDPTEFACRLESLRREHGRKVTFIQRLGHTGLRWARRSPRPSPNWRRCGRRTRDCDGCWT